MRGLPVANRASAKARPAARGLRLVAAHRHDSGHDQVVEFHPRLTVLAGSDPELANWVTSLLGAHAPGDTSFEIDGAPPTPGDMQLVLRDATPHPLRVDALELLASGATAARAAPPGKSAVARLGKELDRWERIRLEAENQLVRAHDRAQRVDPLDVAEAARLRKEWRRADQLNRRARRHEYERFLARFGVRSCEDLSVVGTGFGDTSGDVAIREAATFVSIAGQRLARLRSALETVRRIGPEACGEQIAAGTPQRLPDFDADMADRLVVHALAHAENARSIGPLVVDRALDALKPVARRRACDRLLSHSSIQQVVIVTSCADVARWAAHGRAADVSLTEVADTEPADRVTT
jgi:hypothetical protein